jgi:hypothetical protein
MFKSRRSDALDAWKYFWLHTPVSPVYLIWKFYPKLGQTSNNAVCPFFVIENTITKARFSGESFMF